jgi:hypothetical protein
MANALETLRGDVREAVNILAQDYAVRRDTGAFDVDGYFADLRRTIETRATTLDLVRRDGPMGGGGLNEA